MEIVYAFMICMFVGLYVRKLFTHEFACVFMWKLLPLHKFCEKKKILDGVRFVLLRWELALFCIPGFCGVRYKVRLITLRSL